MLSPLQSRLARAALGWSVREASQAAGVGFNTLVRFEGGGDTYASTLHKIASAYQARGVVLIAAGEVSQSGGDGVRLRG